MAVTYEDKILEVICVSMHMASEATCLMPQSNETAIVKKRVMKVSCRIRRSDAYASSLTYLSIRSKASIDFDCL